MEEKKDIVLDEFNSNDMDDELIDFGDDELEDDLDTKEESEQQQSEELKTDSDSDDFETGSDDFETGSDDFETGSDDFDDLSDFDDEGTTLEEDTEATVEESSINEDESVEEHEEVETSADESEEIASTEEESTDIEEDEPVAEVSKGNGKNSKSSKKEEESEKPVDLVLYMIIDKPIAGLREYFINYGIKLSRVFSNINEARDHLLMQVEPTRIIVVDTGSGRFTNMSSRRALVDLLGICDEDTKVSVFYTDNIIKFEVSGAEETEDKQIEWYKYRSTPDMLANLLQHKKKENYIFDSEKSAAEVSVTKDCLNINGLPVKVAKEINLGSPAIKVDEIILHLEGDIPEEDKIQGYEIKI